MKHLTTAIALFVIHCFSFAEEPIALQTNGCGTKNGWNALLVPNNTIISGCQFKSSCDKHDICYGKCLEGGELFGQSTCDDPSGKAKRRDMCDRNLREDIVQLNPNKRVCGMYASMYHWAVAKFGTNAFHGVTSVEANMVALNAFLEFVAKHPDAFDPEQVRIAFESIDSALNTPVVKFLPYIPQLSIEAYDEDKKVWVPALKVQGKSQAAL